MSTEQSNEDQRQSSRDKFHQTLLNLDNAGLSTPELRIGAFVAQGLLNLEKAGLLEEKETLQDVLTTQYGNKDAVTILDIASKELMSDRSGEEQTEDSYKEEAYDVLSQAWYMSTSKEGGLNELARSLDEVLQDIWGGKWRNLRALLRLNIENPMGIFSGPGAIIRLFGEDE